MLSFSTTPPEEILGVFYHADKYKMSDLLAFADKAGVQVDRNTTSKADLADMLNKHTADEQGWTPEDRKMMCCYLKNWHYIVTLLMLGPLDKHT